MKMACNEKGEHLWHEKLWKTCRRTGEVLMEPRPKEAETETIRFESIQAEPWREEGVLNKHLWEQQHGICVYQGYQKTPLVHFQCQHLVYFSSVFQWCSKGEQKLRFFSSSVSNRSVCCLHK